ncbi:MAG: hypothetical protein DRG71_06035 [Deltaproteobacteria bacterium]|nr:MAG: hypothetical protein DRG71_06035 [Deltaproteobacteria bacterium]HDG96938.1 hypothetical protein [Desulfobacterales bacterium]
MEGKECFGVLDKVFPEGEGGLRQVPQDCFQCPDHVQCLKVALASREGVEFRMGLLNRRRPTGFVDRIKRWSERKALTRSLQKK